MAPKSKNADVQLFGTLGRVCWLLVVQDELEIVFFRYYLVEVLGAVKVVRFLTAVCDVRLGRSHFRYRLTFLSVLTFSPYDGWQLMSTETHETKREGQAPSNTRSSTM